MINKRKVSWIAASTTQMQMILNKQAETSLIKEAAKKLHQNKEITILRG